MKYNISFDICAVVVLSVLICLFHSKKSLKMVQNKVFLTLIYSALVATIGDIISVMGGLMTGALGSFYLYTASTIYYIGINAIPFLYAVYVVALTDTQNSLGSIRKMSYGGKKSILLCLIPPAMLNMVIIFGNLFTGWLFNYDAANNNAYTNRGTIYIIYLVATYFVGFVTVYATKYRKVISHAQRLAIYFFMPIAAIPVLIQVFSPTQLLGMFGISICLLLIFLTIQNQEDLVDSSTGRFNRAAFFSNVPMYYKNKRPFVLISIVITNYNFLRKTFGMLNVLSVIRKAGEALDNASIKGKTVYALSETCLAVVIPLEYMESNVPEKIKEIFEKFWTHDNVTVKLVPKICVFHCPSDAETVENLVDYLEIEKERHTTSEVISYARNIARTTERRVAEVEKAVRNGIKNGNFEVHYQGIYSAKSKSFNSAEALLRLNDPILGSISPAEFIPIAERDGTIIEIGAFVFNEVCRFISTINVKAFGIDYIEINLSVAQCMQEQLANQFLKIIADYNLSTDLINLEITETVAAHSFDMLESNMIKLANSGIKFSLDDYGTGYSSMMSMVELPFHFVKIDRGIVSAIENEKGRIAVSGTIAMLKEMNLKIIAEGVETLNQAQILINMGCDYLQGFYYAKPVCEKTFLSMLAEKNLNS